MRVSLVFASAFLSRLLSALFASSLCRRKDTHWLGFRVFAKEKRKLEKREKHQKRDSYCDALQALYDDDAASSSTLDDFDDAIVVVGLEKVVVVVYVVVSIPVGKRRSRLSRFFEALL